MTDENWTTGGCHCGTVRFRTRLSSGLETARRCDCSLCAMRGAVTLSASLEDFEIERGADALTLYQFNTKVAEHWFCSRCGIYTHHRRRSDPTQFGINAACLDGVTPFDFECVPVNDGKLHPSDRADRKGVIVGYLRFEPAHAED
jgi:hypothetical protein